MVRHSLSVFELPAVLQVGGDAGRAEGVIADPRLDASRAGTALNHPVGVLLAHRLRFAGLAASGARRRSAQLADDAGGGDVLVEAAPGTRRGVISWVIESSLKLRVSCEPA